MKRLLALVLIIAASCGKSITDDGSVPPAADYYGTVTVTYAENDYENPGVAVSYTPSSDGKTVSLTLKNIKFVPQMPVSLDVTIPDISVNHISGVVVLTCDNVVPLAMGGEMPMYTVTHFTGAVDGEELIFSLYFGDYPTSFVGKR